MMPGLDLAREALHARRSRVKIDADRPKRTAFARSIASSSVGVAVQRRHRAEHLLAGELGVVREPLEDGRREQVAVVVPTLAAGQNAAARLSCSLDRSENVLQRALVHQRADLDLGIGRIADLPGPTREQALAELVVDRVLDEDAPRRRALLTGRPECAGVRGLDRAVESASAETSSGL